MLRLPPCFAAVILCFVPLLRQRGWRHAEVLLLGALLVPGQRTVASILRIAGLSRERRFTNYHRVLDRAVWSGRAAGRVLLGLLVARFAPQGAVLLGLDDRSSAGGGGASTPGASTATRYVPATGTSSRPPVCAG
ncbi:transposase [Roseomonas sp. NAR14]|uniref:Transposase n=1 Tax=Roseomonas acroporae TaxID=2937791 RepID=A0A9X1YF05_9PROT|nr:transposase [Roseomonas acroporae]MCK8787925.1 transposase [Roseomonas acroporae]